MYRAQLYRWLLLLAAAVCFRIDHQTGQQVAIKVIDLEEM
jgi:hypothetical protein